MSVAGSVASNGDSTVIYPPSALSLPTPSSLEIEDLRGFLAEFVEDDEPMLTRMLEYCRTSCITRKNILSFGASEQLANQLDLPVGVRHTIRTLYLDKCRVIGTPISTPIVSGGRININGVAADHPLRSPFLSVLVSIRKDVYVPVTSYIYPVCFLLFGQLTQFHACVCVIATSLVTCNMCRYNDVPWSELADGDKAQICLQSKAVTGSDAAFMALSEEAIGAGMGNGTGPRANMHRFSVVPMLTSYIACK